MAIVAVAITDGRPFLLIAFAYHHWLSPLVVAFVVVVACRLWLSPLHVAIGCCAIGCRRLVIAPLVAASGCHLQTFLRLDALSQEEPTDMLGRARR